MIQDVVILGATGNVGSEVVRQIIDRGDTDKTRHENPTRIAGLASGKKSGFKFIYSHSGLEHEQCFDFIEGRSSDAVGNASLADLLEAALAASGNGDGHRVYVDATPENRPMTDFHLRVMTTTNFGIVTANKNPVALSTYPEFEQLVDHPRLYGYRSTVMAGAEAVTLLQDLRDVNDIPRLIKGCFSGTLGYLLTELEKGRQFSSVLQEAKDNGYTETDSRDDLSGLDVARKLIVLARTIGYPIERTDVTVEPFVPKEYFRDEPEADFLRSAANLDSYFDQMMRKASGEGLSLRYVAQMEINGHKKYSPDEVNLEVKLQMVPSDSPLGMLKGTLNKLLLVSETYPAEKPYIVEAPGAGPVITAQNIRRDLLYILKERKHVP